MSLTLRVCLKEGKIASSSLLRESALPFLLLTVAISLKVV